MPSMRAKGTDGVGFQAIKPGTSQKRTVSNSSAQATAFGANTTIVRLHATEDCFVEFGSNPTAIADSSMFLPADQTEYFAVVGGTIVAAIRLSADGNLYITEGAQG